MAFDFKKEYKEFYLPQSKPTIVTIPSMKYIAVRVQGDPNQEDSEYKKSINLLYSIAFTIKMSKLGDHKIDGYFDYVVPPLEGFWWQEGIVGIDYGRKELFRGISVIRLPDFVTKTHFEWAAAEAEKKKKMDMSKVEFLVYDEGLCVQCMHIGPYDPYFLWNGVSSEDYGIMVSEYPVISRPKERVNQITIPGRSGVLMLPESDLPVYEPVLKTAQCWVRPDADIDAICAWLQGSGSVVFGNEPDRSYDARIINQIDFSKILRGRGFRSFAVPFQCQPYKRLYPPAEDITLTASGMTVHNPGTVPAWPKLTLYGSGTITLITYSNAVVLSGIGNGIILDWEAQECMSLDGGTLLNDKVDGDPQHLPPGDSTITWTGTVSRLVVTPNWQFL